MRSSGPVARRHCLVRRALFIAAEDRDLWTWDFAAHRPSRVTNHPAQDRNPVWTRDGRRLIFSSLRESPGNLYVQAADGSGQAERLTVSPQSQVPSALSADGRTLLGNQTLLGPWGLFTLPFGGRAAFLVTAACSPRSR